MTELKWLNCTDPLDLLMFLKGKESERKLRLFACACCRRNWASLIDNRSRDAVEKAEEYADDLLDSESWYAAWNAAREAANSPHILRQHPLNYAAQAAFDTTRQKASSAVSHAVTSFWKMLGSIYEKTPEGLEERIEQCRLFREIVGNPFRPITLIPSCLTSTVLALATGIYIEKAFDRMPILDDALQDAGCDNEDILNHCRQPGGHVKGCWVVDLILSKC